MAHLGSGTFREGRPDTPQKRTLGTNDKAIDRGSLTHERRPEDRAPAASRGEQYRKLAAESDSNLT